MPNAAQYLQNFMEQVASRFQGARNGQTKRPGVDRFIPLEFYSCQSCGRLYNAKMQLGLAGAQPSDNAQFSCECGVVNHIEFERVTRW